MSAHDRFKRRRRRPLLLLLLVTRSVTRALECASKLRAHAPRSGDSHRRCAQAARSKHVHERRHRRRYRELTSAPSTVRKMSRRLLASCDLLRSEDHGAAQVSTTKNLGRNPKILSRFSTRDEVVCSERI